MKGIMDMHYTYEWEIYRDGEGWNVEPAADFNHIVHAKERDEAIKEAADWLQAEILRCLLLGKPVPEATRNCEPSHEGGQIFISTVGIDLGMMRVQSNVAANVLGTTRGRITQLLDSGELLGYKDGRDTYIMLDSLQARLKNRPKRGRPRLSDK